MKLKIFCGISTILFMGQQASAQLVNPDYAYLNSQSSMYLSSSYLIQETSNQLSIPGYSDPVPSAPEAAPHLTVAIAGPAVAPRELAMTYPSENREKMERLFHQILEGYCDLEIKTDLIPGELANAISVFVIGNYAAYHGVEPSDSAVKTVVQQMRFYLNKTGKLSSASDRDKQVFYESLAIVGTFMALMKSALDRQPDPAMKSQLREAARSYLMQVLKLNPDDILISEKGLTRRNGQNLR